MGQANFIAYVAALVYQSRAWSPTGRLRCIYPQSHIKAGADDVCNSKGGVESTSSTGHISLSISRTTSP